MTVDLQSLGWDDSFAKAYARYARPDHAPGRITRVDRGVCSVLSAGGVRRASVGGAMLAAAARDPRRLPCAGDWVVLQTWPDDRCTIEAVLPRRTALTRAGAGTEHTGQTLAANIDTVAIVVAVEPAAPLARIERMLAIGWESGAQPLVVLTKVDLIRDVTALAAQIADIAPGVEVVAVSVVRDTGLDALRRYVTAGRTLGLLGASGSGKSSLVNALAGTTVMGTQAIRDADGRGRHTTTFRALVPLPTGGSVLDTPGIRGVGLLDGDAGLDRAFGDIDELARLCRFPDCAHDGEPGCAVVAAVREGFLPPRRLNSWRRLRQEISAERARSDVRLSARRRRAAWADRYRHRA